MSFRNFLISPACSRHAFFLERCHRCVDTGRQLNIHIHSHFQYSVSFFPSKLSYILLCSCLFKVTWEGHFHIHILGELTEDSKQLASMGLDESWKVTRSEWLAWGRERAGTNMVCRRGASWGVGSSLRQIIKQC
jgi:hypothetical protein